MTSKQRLIEDVSRDWGEAVQSRICQEIIEYILSVPSEQLVHITYGTLRNITHHAYSNQDLLSAIQYLDGDAMSVLEIKFELFDEEECFPLEQSEVTEAHRTGYLIHPETGEEISDFESKVLIYFDASKFLRRISI